MEVLNRREFIGLGVGAFAAGGLEALAQPDCQLWYAQEVSGAAALAMPILKDFHPTRLEIAVGATGPFSLLHISDSHIAQMNSRDLAKADAVELKWYEGRRRHFQSAATGLAAALLYARAKKLPVLHTGDLVDYLSEANCNIVRTDLEGIDCQYAVGNHEFCGTPRPGPRVEQLAAARKRAERHFPNPLTVHARVRNGVNFVTFDNVGLSDDVADMQFAAIAREFDRGLPVVLACHVPFYTEELADALMASDGYKPKSRADIHEGWLAACPGKETRPINARLSAWLPTRRNLKAILCGHLHFEARVPFAGVTQYVAGATYLGNAYEITFT